MAALLLLEPPTTPAVKITILDVSFGGLGFSSPESHPVDSLVTLQWEAPPFRPGIKVLYRGRIKNVREKKSLTGQFVLNMEFDGSDPESVQKVLDWAQMQVFLQSKARTRGKSSMSY